jgi:hypothetical protein
MTTPNSKSDRIATFVKLTIDWVFVAVTILLLLGALKWIPL